ncbi:unnamed protein product, partial [Prorocentrum cordatum]
DDEWWGDDWASWEDDGRRRQQDRWHKEENGRRGQDHERWQEEEEQEDDRWNGRRWNKERDQNQDEATNLWKNWKPAEDPRSHKDEDAKGEGGGRRSRDDEDGDGQNAWCNWRPQAQDRAPAQQASARAAPEVKEAARAAPAPQPPPVSQDQKVEWPAEPSDAEPDADANAEDQAGAAAEGGRVGDGGDSAGSTPDPSREPELAAAVVASGYRKAGDALPGEPTMEERPLELLRHVGGPASEDLWQDVIADEHLRCWLSWRPGGDAVTEEDLREIVDNAPWTDIADKDGRVHKACWMVREGCSCPFRYGKDVLSPDTIPPW